MSTKAESMTIKVSINTKDQLNVLKINTRKSYDEAIDKLIWERMDVEKTKQILHDIQNGKIMEIVYI